MNDVQTLSLTDFLLARIAARETVARDMQDQALRGRPFFDVDSLAGGTGIRELIDPGRILAACEAHRIIVEEYAAHDSSWRTRPAPENPKRLGKWYHDMTDDDFERYEAWVAAVSLRDVVERLAAIYADHPDYNLDWRP